MDPWVMTLCFTAVLL